MIKTIRGLAILLCLPLMATQGHDVRYTAGQRAVGIPFESTGRQVALEARVNERDGLRLVIDTGAGDSVLDAASAASLGLKAEGVQHSRGAGGLQEGSTVRGVNVRLPGFELLDQTMGTLALGPIAAQAGRPLDGILGRPLFERCVVEIDFPRKSVSLFDPSSYVYQGSGASLPITFKDGLPYVKATVVLSDGRSISGKFVIDTGAATNLILSSKTIEREDVNAAVAKTMTVQARGVGGVTEVRLARLGRFELGGFSLAQPVAALQAEGAGYISANGTVGNIGAGILSRFKVIFDYSRRRMILEPGPDLAQPFDADMSGLGLVAAPPDFRSVSVVRVLDGSPAFEAGIQPGDVIESVDGTPVGDVGLPPLRERLRREGEVLRLTLNRRAETITLELKTRRMI